MPPVADLLAFEEQWRRHTPAKEEAIRAQLGVTPARFYQLLNRVIRTREAAELAPQLVGALLRRRA